MVRALLRFLSRIWIRLLAFNLLLIFLAALSILSLEVYEEQLLDFQERSMVQQGRLLAAALGGRGEVSAEEAEAILRNLERRTKARLRVIDRRFNLLADSARLGPRREDVAEPPATAARESWTYRLGAGLYRLYERVFQPPVPPPGDDELDLSGRRLRGPEVLEALEGKYGRRYRITRGGQRSVTLYSAIPIRSGDEVVGVVLVSQSTFRILQALYDFRLSAFRVVLASIAAAVVLSLVVATTIARPLGRLRSEARAMLDRRGRLRGHFKASKSLDEIGDLSRALAELTRRLEEHQELMEAFASDVSHELKNPLASIRNAAELLAETEEPAERERFLRMVLQDVARLEHLLSDVREIAQIDAGHDELPSEPVMLQELLRGLVESYSLRRDHEVSFRLEAPEEALTVDASPERLTQVFTNLLDNAVSFSPPGSEVTIEVERRQHRASVRVRDRGPGIPPEHLERIFARFFSYRPSERRSESGHTGLGLAIVKAIVEASGGRIRAENARPCGAAIEVELPLAGG